MTNPPQRLIQPFFANSIAKSGTHLLRPLLEGIPSLNHYDFIYPGVLHQLPEHRTILSKMPPNNFSNGHIHYSKDYEQLFRSLNLKQIFLYRDPRDIVVSYAYFFMKLKGTPTYRYFTENNLNIKKRCLAIINGFKTDYTFRGDINTWYRHFTPWRDVDYVLPISYESLIESPSSLHQQLVKIIRFLNIENNSRNINVLSKQMQNNVNPLKSPTFRNGQSGNWEIEFDDEIKSHFKRVAGNLLIELGYEKDDNW
ncbi:sulfotransferase domain-containing protein [Pseudalkalibacillus sp. A8]|uniref:sulfotransferase domain-containing protein n=1 Tax=Pseudalkalibacillus sp. A8 TaxID=3382641 RepID=UPI0038B58973